ncbi:MAG: DNA-binding protein WhiA [Ruminococcaceae bacterium]|nr:DNA-binding protein WhiA [Oscillospiraceae bacterium]
MSFSENVRAELIGQPRKLTCCKKAFAYGLLINTFPSDEGLISFETESEILSNEAENIIKDQFGKVPEKSVRQRMGHERSIFTFSSRSGVETLKNFDENADSSYSELVGFRCESCRMNFLRGAFLSSASVSDPMKSYHLEFILKSAQRAKLLFSELREAGFSPKIANRRSGVGLYFKESEAIEDILTYLGASRMLFECMNDKILREIRNDTNRRANCETGNIAKSISASQELIASIKRLEEAGLLAALPDELCETARIRLEYPEASMSEICAMFSPPLSKSGLSHRFSKIKRFAEDIGKK